MNTDFAVLPVLHGIVEGNNAAGSKQRGIGVSICGNLIAGMAAIDEKEVVGRALCRLGDYAVRPRIANEDRPGEFWKAFDILVGESEVDLDRQDRSEYCSEE